MGNSLTIERRCDDGVTRIALSGEITEEARFDELGPIEGAVVLDLAGIRRINSCGVREWIRFVRQVPPGTRVAYERCSPAIVTQANMIANFLGDGRVRSFVAPYYCETCDRAVEVLLDVERDFPERRPAAPERRCEACHGPLAFDDVEESYLAFVLSPP